jgi:trk system potassium uptake protein TrkA
MNIVIVGDGKVGYTIAQQLVEEGHDLTIIENKKQVLENTVNSLDVVGILGSGTDPDVLEQANIRNTDILIAATSNDEVNIICSLVAKKMGARHTIARIRTPEYSKDSEIIKDELGLSLQINPELEAAREIRRALRFNNLVKVTSFAKGRMELAEIKIQPESALVGKTVAKINSQYHSRVLFCCIRRGEKIIIPDGSTTIQAGDKLSLTGRTKQLQSFFTEIGILKKKRLSEVMVIGGGRIAYYLTPMLQELGLRVRIIERDEQKCMNLVEKFPDATIICGDGTDQELLKSESVDEMDAFVALTDIDEENVIAAMFAQTQGVPRVLPKVNRVPLSFLLDKLGLENTITPKNITANHIVQYVRAMQNSFGSNVESLIKILDDQVEVLEFRVRENCQFINTPIKNIKFKSGILAAYITHHQVPEIVNGDSKAQLGDTVIIISKVKGLRDINDVLA